MGKARRTAAAAPEGWAWTEMSHTRHYFRDGRSLCGRFAMLAEVKFSQATDRKTDCWRCVRALKKEGGKQS